MNTTPTKGIIMSDFFALKDSDQFNIMHNELTRAAAAKPRGFVYGRPNHECLYYDNGKPSCIFGHVFHALGIGTFFMEGATAGVVLGDAAASCGVVSAALRCAATVTQARQDAGAPWDELPTVFYREYVERGGEV